MFDPENEGTTLYLEVGNGVNFGRPESQQHRSENLKIPCLGNQPIRSQTSESMGRRVAEMAGGRTGRWKEG